MRAATLDREAALRARVRTLIAELRALGVPDSRIRNKSIVELDEMLSGCYRQLMQAPRRAA